MGHRRSYLPVLLAASLFVGCSSNGGGGGSQDASRPSSAADNGRSSRAEAGRPQSTPNAGQEPNAQQARPTPPESLPPFEPLEPLASMEVDVVGVGAMAFAPNGRTFITGGGTPKIWQIGNNEPLFAFEDLYPLTGEIVEADVLAISSDGAALAIGGGDGLLHLFDFATREPRHSIEAHSQGVLSVAFSLDGKTIATSGYDGKAKLFSSETGEPIKVFDVDEGSGVRVDLAADGKTLVSAGTDAFVWSAESGEKIGDLNLGVPRAVRVFAVAMSPDGQQIATAELNKDFENGVLIWSTAARKLIGTLKHELGVMSLAFSPDGKLLATASADVKAHIWRLADGSLLQTIELEGSNSVDDLAWTPDGKVLAVVSEGTIHFWGPKGAIESVPGAPAETDGTSDTPAPTEEALSEEAVPDATAATPVFPESSIELRAAATVAIMREMIDLTSFPRIEGGDYQTTEATEVSYLAPVPLPEAREFYRKHLSEAGWKEHEQSVAQLDSDESWLREFEKDGYFLRLFLNAFPEPVENQQIMVEVLQMGNVDTRTLPTPSDANKTYESAAMTSFSTKSDANTFIDACRKQFERLGWTDRGLEEGAFGRKLTLVQNAVRLQVDIRESGAGTDVSYDVFVIKE